MPRARSSGALSIWSYDVNVAPPVPARTFVIAAVSDVFPWSTCPIVPMLQCGLVRANFSLAMTRSALGGQKTHDGRQKRAKSPLVAYCFCYLRPPSSAICRPLFGAGEGNRTLVISLEGC